MILASSKSGPGLVWRSLRSTCFLRGPDQASSQIATLAQFGNTRATSTSLFAGNGPETTLTSGGSLAQFLPGQSNSTTLDVGNRSSTDTSASPMVVPSNDSSWATPHRYRSSTPTVTSSAHDHPGLRFGRLGFGHRSQQSITTALTFHQGANTPAAAHRISQTVRSPHSSPKPARPVSCKASPG